MHRLLLPFYFAAFFLFIPESSAAAAPLARQSHATIVAAVERHLRNVFAGEGEGLILDISPLDHRLRLPPCDGDLDTFDPPGGIDMGRTTVGVSCRSPKPWTLYVSANVGREQAVVVAKRSLSRGEPIQATDLKFEIRDISHLLRGHFTDPDELSGRILKRTLRRGQAITPSMLVARKSIRRGEPITILSEVGPIEVRSRGKALRDGNPGDLIPVMNIASKKKLEARVVAPGLVSVH